MRERGRRWGGGCVRSGLLLRPGFLVYFPARLRAQDSRDHMAPLFPKPSPAKES